MTIEELIPGLEVDFEQVPTIETPEEWAHIEWKVVLRRGRHTLEWSYSQGTGFLPPHLQRLAGYSTLTADQKQRIEATLQCRPHFDADRLLPPATEDVVLDFVKDVCDILEAGTFENYMSEYGYGEDSLKEYRSYRTYLRRGLKAIAFFGMEQIVELRKIAIENDH